MGIALIWGTISADSKVWEQWRSLARGGAGELGVRVVFLASSDPLLLLQLDSEDAEPNFDEDGQDEYNELHMPV